MAESSEANKKTNAEVETLEQKRERCHKLISGKDNNYHGALIQLIEVGNKESVPLLIQVLVWNPVERCDENTIGVDCTTQHCVDALKSITGMDFGYSPEKWNEWWKSEGNKLPEEHFKPRNKINE